MKFMSYTCFTFEESKVKQWLTEEVGVTIFKIIEQDEATVGPGKQTMWSKIIFYVPDAELETIIKLKYPSGTFRDHMA